MAGYLLPEETWTEFSIAWSRALRRKPSIRYLKMVEAQNLRGEFRHWTVEQKNKKLDQLAAVIRKFDPASFQFSVSRVSFDRIYRSTAPYGLARPHFVCTFGIVSIVTKILASIGLPDAQVELIFDRQDGVSTDMSLFFEYMTENLPDDQRRLIKAEPVYEDDLEYLPLQAADMLAWHLRREHEGGKLFPAPIMSTLRGEMHYTMQLEADMMVRWAKHDASHPEVPKTKTEWKNAILEARELLATGFKPPHGDATEIHEARVRHLYEMYKSTSASDSTNSESR